MLTAFIITAGHLDIEWYQPLHSYRFWTIDTFEDLKIAAKRPDFRVYVLDGQVFPLEEYLHACPEDEAAMRALIADGKLAIGPFYTQFDEWLPSAENIIRNCLFGKRRAMAYGGWMRAGYLPDNFGHPMQLPQILQGFGIDSLMFMRGMPEVPGGHPDEFLYEGLDGSQVLVSHFRESYSGAFNLFDKPVDPIQPREAPYYPDYLSFEYHRELAVHDDPARIAHSMIANVRRIEQRYPSGVIPLIAGYDHLPPQINVGDTVALANSLQQDIRFVMGTAEEYTAMVRARLDKPTIYAMELIGSMYQYVLLGALSTRSYLKRQNFACEALLERYAEPIMSLASLHGHKIRPRLLNEAWQHLLVNSAHDSIHGSSVDETHIDMESRFGAARQIATGLIHDALSSLGRQLPRWWPEAARATLVHAPIQADFPQPAEVYLAVGDAPASLYGADGQALPTQWLPREPIALNGIGLPRNDPFPSAVYRKALFLAPPSDQALTSYATGAPADVKTDLCAEDHQLENEWLRVRVQNGLLSIFDKTTSAHYHGLNLLVEDADAGDAWDYAPSWIPGEVVLSTSARLDTQLVESGPVRATLRLTGDMSVPAALIGDVRSDDHVRMPIQFDVSLYAGLRRVDVTLTLDNNAKDHRVRLRVPMGMRTDFIRSQSHLAILDRPIERQREQAPWRQPPTQLLPFREWLAAQNQTNGLAIAFKGLYDYEATINPLTAQPEVAVTLLRSIGLMGRRHTPQRSGGASDAIVTPGAQCPGTHRIQWSYLPYTPSDEDKAPFLPLAQSALYPPVTHAVRSEPMAAPTAVPLPIAWDAPNVQLSALKPAYDQDDTILRLYENQGKQTKVRIRLQGFEQAFASNMDEATLQPLPIDGDVLELDFAPYKALTIKLC